MSHQSDNTILRIIFRGEPIKLRWGAWVTDTYLLQREGWKFSAEEHYEAYSHAHVVHLAATCPNKNVIIAGRIYIRPEELLLVDRVIPYHSSQDRSWNSRHIDMQQFSCKDVFRSVGMDEIRSWEGMKAIDVLRHSEANIRQVQMGDFKFFKELEDQQNEIYIPQKNVDELFNEILKIQYPQQQEIKKGLIMPEAKPLIQAKIYSLVA